MAEHPQTREQSRPTSVPRRLVTEKLFFPVAAGYGAVAVVLSVHGLYGGRSPPGLSSAPGHAHEMFFGYALAVVAGFLIHRLRWPLVGLLLGLWLVARILFLAAPGSPGALLANGAFAASVAAGAAPQFMKAAKKWRNRVIGPLVIAICAAAIAMNGAWLLASGTGPHALAQLSVILFALLMLFFGGRLIAPAAAGAIEQAGGRLEARVQPHIEGGLLVLMTFALLAAIVPGGRAPAGMALAGAGFLALVRLLRWRLWKCYRRIDLLCLGIGYAWLGAGLVLVGFEYALGSESTASTAVHAITVGALGTLTTNVMARTRLVRIRRRPESMTPWFVCMTAAASAAALIRILAPPTPATMLFAAGLWSLALVTLLVVLLRWR